MRSKGAIDLPCFRKQHTTFTCLWFCYESKPWGPRYPIHPNLERMGFDPSALQWTAGRKSNHSLTWKVRLLWDSYPNPARIILVMSWHEVATIYQFIQIGSICNIASVGYTLPQCNLLKKNHPWLKSELHWVTGNCHIWWRVFLAHLWWNNPWLAFGINHLNLETEFRMSVVRVNLNVLATLGIPRPSWILPVWSSIRSMHWNCSCQRHYSDSDWMASSSISMFASNHSSSSFRSKPISSVHTVIGKIQKMQQIWGMTSKQKKDASSENEQFHP